MLEPGGTASSIVLGGANTAWAEVGARRGAAAAAGARCCQSPLLCCGARRWTR
jgi:hypothetical protein